MKRITKFKAICILFISIAMFTVCIPFDSYGQIESDWKISKDGDSSKWNWNKSSYFTNEKKIERKNSKYEYDIDADDFEKIMEYQDEGYEIYFRVKFQAKEIHNSNLLVCLGLDRFYESKWSFLNYGDSDDDWHSETHNSNDATKGPKNAYYASDASEETRIEERDDLTLYLNCYGDHLDEYKVKNAYLEFAIVDVVPPEVESVKYYDNWEKGSQISDGRQKLSYSGDRDYIDMVVKFDEAIDLEEDDKKFIRTNLSLNDTIKGSFAYHAKKGDDSIVLRYTVQYGDYARAERRKKEDGSVINDKTRLELQGKATFLEDLSGLSIVDKFGNEFTKDKAEDHEYLDVKDFNVNIDGDPPEITEVEYSVVRNNDSHGDGPFLNVGDEVILKVKLGNLREGEKAIVDSEGYFPFMNGGRGEIFEREPNGYTKDDWIVYKYTIDNDKDKNTINLKHTITANPKTKAYFEQVSEMSKKMAIHDDFGNYARMQNTGDDKYDTINFNDVAVPFWEKKSIIIVDTVKPKVEFTYDSNEDYKQNQKVVMKPEEKGSMPEGGEFYYVISKNPNHPTNGPLSASQIGRITYPYTRTGDGTYTNIDNLKDIEIDDDLYLGVEPYKIYDQKYNPVTKEISYEIEDYTQGTATDVVFDGRREISGDFYIHTYMKDRSGNESWQTSNKISLDNTHMNIAMSPMGTSQYVGNIDISFQLLEEELSGFKKWEYRWITPLAEKNIDSDDIYTKGTDTYEILRESNSNWKAGESLDSYKISNVAIPEFDIREHGDNYLLIRAYDEADNESYIVSEPFKFDKEAPDMTFESMSGAFDSPLKNHEIKVVVDDEHSVLGEYKYYFSKSNKTRELDDPIWKTLPLDFPEFPEGYDPFDDKEYGDLSKKEAILNTNEWNDEALNGYTFLHVFAKDINGNEVSQVQSMVLDNGGYPSISFEYDNTVDNQYKDVVGHILATDDGGVEELYYKWSDSKEKPGDYETFDLSGKNKSNFTIDTPVMSTIGQWYLHVKAVDVYGNITSVCSEVYSISEGPRLEQFSIDLDELIYTNKPEVAITLSKEISNDKEYNYVIYDDESCTNKVDSGEFSSDEEIINIDLQEIEEDKQVFYIKIEDNIGLSTEKSFKVEAVYDVTAPTAKIVYTPEESEGVAEETVRAELTNIKDNVSESVKSNTESHDFVQNGEFDFILTDQAGNKTVLTAIVNWMSEDRPKIRLISDQVINEIYNDVEFSIKAQRPTSSGYKNISEAKLSYKVAKSESEEIERWTDYENGKKVDLSSEDGSYYIHTRLKYEGKTFTEVFGPYIVDNGAPEIDEETYTYVDSEGASQTVTAGAIKLITDISSDISVNMTFNEEVIIKSITDDKNNKLATKFPIVFSENGSVTIVVADNAGNEIIKEITISSIKKESVAYDLYEITPDTVTNGSVTVNISAPEGLVFKDIVKNSNPVTSFITSGSVTYTGYAETYYNKVEFDVEENCQIQVEAFTVTSSGVDTYTLTSVGLFTKEVKNIDKKPPEGSIAVTNVDSTRKKASLSVTDKNPVEIRSVKFVKADGTTIILKADTDMGEVVSPSEEGLVFKGPTNELYFEIDGKVIYEVSDSANNKALIESDVTSIDTSLDISKVSAKYKIGERVYTSVGDINPVNENIEVTLEMPGSYSVVNNSGSKSKVFAAGIEYDFLISNGEDIKAYHIDLRDKINKSSLSVDMDYTIDGKPYKDELINGRTNQDVVLTITGDNLSKVSFNGSEVTSAPYKYTFTQNEIINIVAKDSLGNEESFKTAVDFIDKTPVRAGLFSLYTRPTKDNITLQFLSNKAVDIISIKKDDANYTSVIDGDSVFKYEFDVDNNGTYSLKYEDELGNENTVEFTVENFDRKAPKLKLLYNESETLGLTKKDVYVKVALVDEDSEVGGIKVLNTIAGELGYLFKENGSFTFRVSDAAGNISEITAVVNNIDRTPPSVEVNYSETGLTNNDVRATVAVGESGFKILNKDISSNNNENVSIDGNNINFTFTDNGYYKLDLCDKAENKTTVVLRVLNIDRVSPTMKFEEAYIVTQKGQMPKLDDYFAFDSHSGDITADVIVSDLDISTEGKKTVQYRVSDEAGNETVVDREILVVGDDFTIVVDGEIDPIPYVTEKDTTDIKIFNFTESAFVKYGIGKDGSLKDSQFKQNNSVFAIVNDTTRDGKTGTEAVEFYGEEYGWHTVYIQDVNRRTKKFTVYITKVR